VLLLASASPRRAALLASAGVHATVLPVGVDESWLPQEAPVAYARRVALAKAEAGAHRKEGAVVLAADTVVWTTPHEPPLGKPHDRDAARRMIERLTGQDAPHFVTTAWAVLDRRRGAGVRPHVAQETTRVWMRALAAAELDAYLDEDDWRDKAGGYGIQSRAAGLVTRLEGSYTNVVGLPLAQVIEYLHGLAS
jgi:septum formation protein